MKGFCIFAVAVSLGLFTQTQGTFGATVTPLWEFTGGHDGGGPDAGLVQGSDSNFYGTTDGGGINDWGTIFRVTPTGSFTNLYLFTGLNDGGSPEAGLTPGYDGNFYGTTLSGGSNGVGVVFRVTPQGTLTTLWQFSSNVDGEEPEAGLVQGIDSNFYGTTFSGGTNFCSCGTVFKITTAGTLTTLWQFSGGNDGSGPEGSLVQGSDSNFYGTTSYDGAHTLGTIFKITSAGTLTPLWQFTGGSDGAYPAAGLVQGSDSNFYGTAIQGGSGNGTVFKITSAGTLTPLHSFSGGSGGDSPSASLIQAQDGLFYGTTAFGGTNGYGTVFSISSSGAFTNLYLFTGHSDGSDPQAALVQGFDGNFYGTAFSGGTSNAGTVFKLSTSNAVSVSVQITAIQIIGTNVVVTMPSTSGDTYQLQFTASMVPTNWANVVGASQSGTGSPIMLTNVGGALQTQRFYRVGISP